MHSALPVRRATITTASKTKSGAETRSALIWDWPVRVFHWLLVLSLAGSWITAEAGYDWTEQHFLFGYFALGLIVFRLLWGVTGTRHARFANFTLSPRQALESTRRLLTRSKRDYAGHNPLGAWSVVLMLVLVAVQATTGLFISDDIFYAGPYNGVVSGDLAGTLAQVHHLNFTALQIVVALHVVSVLWYLWGKRQNLLRPMITGRKALPMALQHEAIDESRSGRAWLVIVIAAAAVTALVQLAPPPPVVDYF